MPSWLCKIWKVFSNLLGKIVDFITDVLDTLVNLAVKAMKGLADAVLGSGPASWLLLGLIGVGVYMLFSKEKKESVSLDTRGPYDRTGGVY